MQTNPRMRMVPVNKPLVVSVGMAQRQRCTTAPHVRLHHTPGDQQPQASDKGTPPHSLGRGCVVLALSVAVDTFPTAGLGTRHRTRMLQPPRQCLAVRAFCFRHGLPPLTHFGLAYRFLHLPRRPEPQRADHAARLPHSQSRRARNLHVDQAENFALVAQTNQTLQF